MSNFNDSIKTILEHEKGYVDHQYDRGGETKYGISKKRYPNIDIPALTWPEAKDIYRRDFWDRFGVGQIHRQDIATHVLDILVLHGQGPRLIQKALNHCGQRVTVDNKFGPQTRAALNKVTAGCFHNSLVSIRKDYMHSLVRRDPTQKAFIKGWLKRADNFLSDHSAESGSVALALLAGAAAYLWSRARKRRK
jgi:lysozyme family protein